MESRSFFESEELSILTSVLDRVCGDAGIHEQNARQRVAARIISIASRGERDFEVLRRRATLIGAALSDCHW
jgi:hypothetical protein